jgi:predicted transcriptional regulator
MKYRSRIEIISTMLRVANKGATKTQMMYGAFLSYPQVKGYTEFLLQKDLIRKQQGTALYSLTEKGVKFLRISREIEGLIGLDKEVEQRIVATE